MKIKRLYINNFKSLVNFELVEPNAFSVFVGPNAAGKSNVFEALEFFNHRSVIDLFPGLFGGRKSVCNRQNPKAAIEFSLELSSIPPIHFSATPTEGEEGREFDLAGDLLSATVLSGKRVSQLQVEQQQKRQFLENFSRIFIRREDLVKVKTNGDLRLRLDAGNLENVLWRLLQDEIKREEIIEWMQAMVPELEKVEVSKSELSGELYLHIFERHLPEPLTKDLISDGTYNLIALLTAIYQSNEPQFLCIEEPENGLNPYIIRTLVEFFRNACEEKGHYIWLNTHSATLVRELKNEEIILLDKKEGVTKAKQIPPDFNRYDLTMDEAWLTNVLGGGLPW